MNEKNFQEFLEKEFSFSHGIGIGDDAAVIKQNDQNFQIITKDILIEDIHFKLDYFSFDLLAQKAIAVNLSDIAAMGAIPEYFFLGLGVPKKYQKDVNLFFKGVKKSCDLYNIELAGGDYSSSDLLFISITMIGRGSNPVFRKNAEVQDYVCITKSPGESALGLKLLQSKQESEMSEDEICFANKQKQVVPELAKGQLLSEYANSMMDVSDGLIKDLNRILTSSKKGSIIYYDKIPVSNRFKLICNKYNISEEEMILSGGEDYGLLFTISKEKEILLNKKQISYTIIGEITTGNELKINKNNKFIKNKFSGYDHFKN